MTAKGTVRELLDRLPDDIRLDTILYHPYVVRETEAGLADIAAARVLSHGEGGEQLPWPMAAAGIEENEG